MAEQWYATNNLLLFLFLHHNCCRFYYKFSDKQEIKTVRIVKRESERRHRDKDKINSNFDAINNDFTNSDDVDDYLANYQAETRANKFYEDEPSVPKTKSTIRNFINSRNNNTKSTTQNDNIFQSNTARELLSELSTTGKTEQNTKSTAKEQQTKSGSSSGTSSSTNASNLYKRFTPRKKKRHNTAPNSENFLDYMAERDSYKYVSRKCGKKQMLITSFDS